MMLKQESHSNTPRFILSGGGTGGHIFPAIAIADALKQRYPDAAFLFVGAKDKMEMQKVPAAGYAIRGLWIAGLQRKLSFDNSLFPVKLLSSLLKARTILADFKPDIAIGTGGFASGPLLQVAELKGIPTLIQEQNSYPGITNKMLAKRADAICVAYEGLERYFPKKKIHVTGNPVRQDLIGLDGLRQQAIEALGLDSQKKTLLVLGGSLGARRINELIAKELPNFSAHQVQIIWQCGKFYYEKYKTYNLAGAVKVMSFIDRMDLVYAAADFVISRAGASSVSELCLVGKPVIFIPSPNVAADHQTKNASAIASQSAAILLREAELDTQFTQTFNKLLSNVAWQMELGQNIKKLGRPQATQDIINEISRLIGK